MTPQDLINSLRTVPEKRLQIFQLIRDLTGTDGRIDDERASFQAEAVKLASDETAAYAQATERLRRTLEQCLKGDHSVR